ncbi:MAG: hypothetical protein SVZ03_16330 [Spirochaetota bacterium]|nr:hypothetical protein [Spirochaetota bacterium]
MISSNRVLAIGEIAVGMNVGITYDPNHLEDEINKYNIVMETYKESNPGSRVSTIDIPYSPLLGFNFRYQFNYLLFRLGCHLAKPVYTEGSITPLGGVKNKIRVTTYQNSYPLSIGFILPLKERTYFFMGVGLAYNQAYVKINQSVPSQSSSLFSGAGLSTNRRDRYTQDFAGYHLIFGAEVPINKRFTVSTEWIHQEGRSYPLNNGGIDESGNEIILPRRTINVEGDFILFGVNYYIKI